MGVIYDDTHKKIDTRDIKSKRQKLNVSLGAVTLSLIPLSGSGKSNFLGDEIKRDKTSLYDMFDSNDSNLDNRDNNFEREYDASNNSFKF